jgi:EmrB/QacA subfamily drug resistance transporter
VTTSRPDRWLVLAAVGSGVFLGTIDGSIVNVALPTLSRHFGVGLGQVQWVVLGYLLAVVSLTPVAGRLADMAGRRRIYAAGFVVFTLGSLLCAMATGIWALVAARFVQAVGGAAITALGSAIVTEAFPPGERGRALGAIGSIVSIGIVIGPTAGGLILSALSWNWIFLVNLPIGFVGTWLVLRHVPLDVPGRGERFDLAGGVSLFLALSSFLIGLTLEHDRGLSDPTVLGLLGVAAASLVLFVVIERRSPWPLVDLSLLASPQLSVSLVTGVMTFVAVAGSAILMPFYLHGVLHHPIRTVGFLLAVVPVSMGLVAPFAGSAADRFGPRRLTVAGLAVMTVALFGIRRLGLATTNADYLLIFVPVGIAFGLFQSPNISLIMGSAPPGRLGVVSGLASLSRTMGQTIGIATVGALWASRVVARGGAVGGGPSAAPPGIQVAALHDTYLVLSLLVGGAALLAARELLGPSGGRALPAGAGPNSR